MTSPASVEPTTPTTDTEMPEETPVDTTNQTQSTDIQRFAETIDDRPYQEGVRHCYNTLLTQAYIDPIKWNRSW